jgi:hypothetical protein
MISARLLLVSIAIASLATACDLNPQPLPPGEEAEGGANAQSPGDNGGTNSATGGSGDGGASNPTVGNGEAGVDASRDGESDGATDGESDAPFDAGDAAD